MKAFIARKPGGVVTSGWVLRDGMSIESTMCRMRRTRPDIVVEDASVETVLRYAAKPVAVSDPLTGTTD